MGTMTPPPGWKPVPRPSTSVAASSGSSPFKVLVWVLVGVAAFLYFKRPSYLPGNALAAATPQGRNASGTSEPITCTGKEGCLVVYVAPWCGPCRSSLPGDVALADHIRALGYETHFVVGMDDREACLEMVKALEREARLDPDGSWAKKAGVRGVPHFLVTTPTGKIRHRQAGAYLAPPDQVAKLLEIG
jgi:hypothetical protein